MMASSKQKPTRRGQSAMEFFMRYRWVILVVLVVITAFALLVVIAAFAYFGVLGPTNVGELGPTNILPDRCTFPLTFTCTDYAVRGRANSVADDVISLNLVNNAGNDIILQGISAYGTPLIAGSCLNNTGATVNTVPQLPITISSGSEQAIVINNCNLATSGKERDRYLVNVSYTFVGSTLARKLQGELLTKRES